MQTVVFFDPTFPYEGALPSVGDISAAWPEAIVCRADQLSDAISMSPATSCLVTLHGPYFPQHAWRAILQHLQRGGGWLHVGGAPFKFPVTGQPGSWVIRGEVTAYHQQLSIHEALQATVDDVQAMVAHADIPVMVGCEALLPIVSTYGLILTPAQKPDHPDQMGAASTMDTRIYPLIKGMSQQGRHLTSPAVLLEHYRGRFAGGRWLLVNQCVDDRFWREGGGLHLQAAAKFCERGVTEMWVKPQYATYLPGEQATLTYQIEKIVSNERGTEVVCEANGEIWQVDLGVYHRDQLVWRDQAELAGRPYLQTHTFQVPVSVLPGRYDVVCIATCSSGEQRTLRQGFWGRDDTLLSTGDHLTAGRDYFFRAGKPLPIVGMTYMTSDVGRKFLTLPNVHAWNADMAQMRSAGINLIRTGIWTAWRHLMLEDGHASEAMLRAIDAFLLTARAYDLEVTFTFFAFTPEAWEGANPYLDSRSVNAQKRFIASIVMRHQQSTHVHWDLINEPSLFDPLRPFSGPRSLGDPHERKAWVSWLKGRHATICDLQHHWNMTPDELPTYLAAPLPLHGDINADVEDLGVLKRGTRWLDYTLFTMDMHNQWIAQLAAVIRACAPLHLVTVGQDEALGLGPRPSPFFYAEAVDYTTVHTWWLNDQLVWDGVFGKSLDKPNLIQETGIMYLETPDNRAKRTEEQLRELLERKYAYAFATGGAGAVQWIWNTNYFMASVNESNIGALRADGSQKPEAQVSYDFGAFIGATSELFVDRALEDIAVVFPYANDFSNRRMAFAATSRAVRILSYDLKMSVRGLGEYHLAHALQGESRPRLVIVPSAHNFSDEARGHLLAYVQGGGTLLWTGPLALDAYWHTCDHPLSQLFGAITLANVSREETFILDGTSYPVSFADKRIAELNKEWSDEVKQAGTTSLVQRSVGKGTMLWCPLPLELSEQVDASASLYEYALAKANVQPAMIWIKGQQMRGIYGTKLPFARGAVYVFASEQAGPAEIVVQDACTERRYAFSLEAQRAVLFAVDAQGALIASYRGVSINVS